MWAQDTDHLAFVLSVISRALSPISANVGAVARLLYHSTSCTSCSSLINLGFVGGVFVGVVRSAVFLAGFDGIFFSGVFVAFSESFSFAFVDIGDFSLSLAFVLLGFSFGSLVGVLDLVSLPALDGVSVSFLREGNAPSSEIVGTVEG